MSIFSNTASCWEFNHYDWNGLDGKAWVANPVIPKPKKKDIDLSDVPMVEDRLLLSLEGFLEKFPGKPLNIEMKKSFKRKINDTDRKGLKDNIKAFTDILDGETGNRQKETVRKENIQYFRQRSRWNYDGSAGEYSQNH
ncbi:MAG: hypothetical protein QNJ58_05280 [Desulfobacterales bacterium]|nr:hypothetical protein [Desulfobacterales bacterium]